MASTQWMEKLNRGKISVTSHAKETTRRKSLVFYWPHKQMLLSPGVKALNRGKISFASHAKETQRKRRRIRRCKVQPLSASPIFSLPDELVVKILALVAASSLTDFLKAKISCKFFNKLSDDDYIYRHMSLDEISWNFHLPESCSPRRAIFDRCLKNGNLEAMYREGMRKCFFGREDIASGQDLLARAAKAGHLGASYVFGVRLICQGGRAFELGLEIIGNIKTGLQMRECRRKLVSLSTGLVRYIHEDSMKPRLLPCLFPDRKRSWLHLENEDDDDDLHCKSCRLNREILHVSDTITNWEKWRLLGFVYRPNRVRMNFYNIEMCASKPIAKHNMFVYNISPGVSIYF